MPGACYQLRHVSELLLHFPEEPLSLRRVLSALLATTVALCVPPLSLAQGSRSNSEQPKAAVFGGYSFYRAGGKVMNATVPDFKKGWAGQLIVNTSPWMGVVFDVNGHYNNFASAHDYLFGLRIQSPNFRIRPFAEGFTGVQHFSPKGLPSQNTAVYAGGAGIDIKVTPKISVRPVQFTFVHTYYDSQKNYFDGGRVQAGLVYNLGLPSHEGEVLAICSADPSAVDAGAPINVSVTAKGFLPKRILSYSYASTGGAVTGNLATASVGTTGVRPGTYTVTATVKDNGRRKHQQTANCQAEFIVKEKLPPSLSISADPASVIAGDASTITVKGSSPDSRPLTYACTASGGQLTGNGPTYTLDTSGAQGAITVKCTVSDDRNLSASATASVEVNAPASRTQVSKFGTIEFKHDPKRPTRVDNEAKGELDRYADALAASPEVKGVAVGYAAAPEDKDKAAQRAVNAKNYLQKDKGTDPARIEPRTGVDNAQKVDLWIVPAGANFAAEGTSVVDESKVRAVPRVPLKPRTHKKLQKSHKSARASARNCHKPGHPCVPHKSPRRSNKSGRKERLH